MTALAVWGVVGVLVTIAGGGAVALLAFGILRRI